MNSLSYLDSVLTRSFAPASERPPSTPTSSAKQSRSHSSLPGSRRASSSSQSTSSRPSSPRRWSQETDDPARSVYNNALRRTGSTPADIHSNALDTDETDFDSRRPARWSGLWGLTGWIDDAIHPDSRRGSRKSSDSEGSSSRRTKRVPSLDDLLLSSTAPQRNQARRTASSGHSSRRNRDGASTSTDESDSGSTRRRSRRQPRFNQASSLTLTSAAQEQQLAAWARQEASTHRQHDPELMTEKEREDIVEFDGGDFAPEDVDSPRRRTVSQSSADSSWGESSSLSHEAATLLTSPNLADTTVTNDTPDHANGLGISQDQHDEKMVDSETLLEAAKGEPEAVEAVAQENPASDVVDAEAAASATPTKKAAFTPTMESSGPVDSEETAIATGHGPHQLDDGSTSASTTPSASQRGSVRRRTARIAAVEALASSSNPSFGTTDSDEAAIDRSLTPSKARRRRSARSSATASARASETEETRQWLTARNGHVQDASVTKTAPPKPRRSSTKRAVRRTLLALRDLLLVVLLCPVNCVRYLRRRRAIRIEEAVEAVYERAQVPILEKNGTSDEHAPLRHRPSSLRFVTKTELKREPSEKQLSSSRPRTPKPDQKDASFQEPVTEDQAVSAGVEWKTVEAGTRTPSKLLPNPQMVDPMLKDGGLIDVGMAEKEAVMEAERQSRIAKGRAARRAAAAGNGGGDAARVETPPPSAMAVSKVPRGVQSNVIHHSPKILVLDLDETLIHSTSRSPSHYSSSGRTTTSGFLGLETAGAVLGLRANDNPRRIRPHMVEVVLDGRSVLYHVYKRPWADYFLRKVSSWYTVVIFTASVQEYADPVIDWLDQGRGLISGRLFRESCTYRGGSYVKNLQVVDKDLSKVCLVDNSPASYRINQANGIPIEGWTNDPNDEALLDLLPVLDSLRFATDVRHVLGIRGW